MCFESVAAERVASSIVVEALRSGCRSQSITGAPRESMLMCRAVVLRFVLCAIQHVVDSAGLLLLNWSAGI
jgi:hypothetical protein